MIAPVRKQCRSIEQQHHDRFLEMLPLIRSQARLAFRRMRPEIKDELVQEAIANAYCRFSRLVRAGKADLAFATPLADFAIRQVIAGRRVGTKLNSRDVFSVVAQRRQGFSVQTLPSESSGSNIWCEILADDTLTPVPDQVAFRLDFPAWLKIQNRRKRELAKFLAVGNSATEAAQRFRVTAARISQLRGELQASWQEFQGETT
jgi:hypothetical protein